MVRCVWLGLICCGIANGLICSFVESPKKYTYMLVVLLVCAIIIVLHHCATRKWCQRKRDENSDYDEDHPRLFINSFVVVLILLIIACLIGNMGCILALSTMLITFMIVAIREAMYAGKFLALIMAGPFFIMIKKLTLWLISQLP